MKKLLCLLLCILLLTGITACGQKYEDTNGEDDYSLQTITDDDIINLSTGSSGMTYTEEGKNLPVSSAQYHSKNFNGVESIYHNYYIGQSDVNIYIGHLTVEKGNLRICIVVDGEIIFDIPLDSFNDTYTFENLEGDMLINVAGESAAFDFSIDIY